MTLFPVGARLPAIARFQAKQDCLSDGIRGQVRAYRVICG